jgi:hypothetical protein
MIMMNQGSDRDRDEQQQEQEERRKEFCLQMELHSQQMQQQ